MLGGNDADFLQGDRGAERLEGGAGADTYIFTFQDDPEPGVMPRTETIDSPGSGSKIVFIGGLNADDITLIIDLNTGELEIQYGYNELTIRSSIYIPNGAEGDLIIEFQFSDGTTVEFETLCAQQTTTCTVGDLIFRNGFESASLTNSAKSEIEGFNQSELLDASGIAADPLLGLALLAGTVVSIS